MIAVVRLAIHKPYTFAVMAFLILIFGGVAAVRTPTDIFPNIGIPVISVIWSYTGLPPDDMAGRIVGPYERSLTTTVNDVEHIDSQSLAGFGVVKIYFQPTVNIDMALAQVTAISQTILKQLPAGITPPQIINFSASSVPIIQLALSSDTLSQSKLNDIATNFIRPQLTTVPGAAIPSAYGGMVRQVQIDLNQHALHAYGLSAQDVVSALSSQNLITPVGTEKIGDLEFTVSLNGSPRALKDFGNLPVKTVGGTTVYMRDVASVHDGNPPQTNVVELNGQKAVLMTVLKAGSASTLNVIAGVKSLLPGLRDSLPTSLNLQAVGDQSAFVKDAVSGVVREGVIAAALTGMMILLFLGSWRSTLIITVSIPLAILASLATLSALGETINVMTLGGLALAVGILVDDATVTIENINWHMEQGKAIEPAILDGAQQIVIPATVSLLCICLAFVPMFGLDGVAGFLFRPLAEAVIFAMIASYILSRTLVPTLANILLRNQHHPHGHDDLEHGSAPPPSRNPLVRFQRGFENGFSVVHGTYRGLLDKALGARAIVALGFFGFTAISFAFVPYLGQNFFPDIDSGAIKMHIRAQTGTRLEQTTALTDRVEAAVRTMIPPAQLGGVVNNIGMPISGINISYGNSGTIGAADVDMLISLKEPHPETADYVKMLREKLPRRFPGTTFSFLPADMVSQIIDFGSPVPIDVQIVGNDLEAGRVYAAKLLAKIKRIPGVVDPRIQQQFHQPTLDVNVNRSLAGFVGLTQSNAAVSMLDTLAGSTQTTPIYWLDPKNNVTYPVSVQTPQYTIDTLASLRNLPLSSGSNTQLLGGLADVVPTAGNAVVSHYNVRPIVDIYVATADRDLGAVSHDINAAIDATKADLPRGTTVVIRGQVATMLSAYIQLIIGLGFAVLLIYLLIVVTFQSWIDPLVIVLALPTALAGIVWMLFTTHTTLSVPALTGAIMCMGVATANSILVISFARERLAEGASGLVAAMDAGAGRFRPVLMTALAMIIGMAPMALEPGQNEPLGRAVIGGLMFATFATLFLVPVLFSMVHGPKRQKPAAAHDTHGVLVVEQT